MTFVTTLAQAGGAPQPSLLESLFPFILLIVVFYFLLIRPQQKRAKEHAAMIEAVTRGDTVVTQGGIIGKVVKVRDEGEVDVEIAKDVVVKVVKATITDVRVKGGKVKDTASDSADKADTKKADKKK